MGNVRYVNDLEGKSIKNNPQLEYICYSKDEGDWTSQVHYHDFMEIAFIVSGLGRILMEDQSFPVKTGDLVIIPPKTNHTEFSAAGSPLEYYIIGVKDFSVGCENQELKTVLTRHMIDVTVENIFSEMFYEMKLKHKNYELMVQSLLLKLSAYIIRATDYSGVYNREKERNNNCAVIKEYIDTHCTGKINLDKLAEISCTSKYHLIHEFSKYVGMTPIAYQLKKRIQESKYLLESTDSSIGDIARALGFSSINHFSKRFKMEEGCSPLKYRQNMLLKLKNNDIEKSW